MRKVVRLRLACAVVLAGCVGNAPNGGGGAGNGDAAASGGAGAGDASVGGGVGDAGAGGGGSDAGAGTGTDGGSAIDPRFAAWRVPPIDSSALSVGPDLLVHDSVTGLAWEPLAIANVTLADAAKHCDSIDPKRKQAWRMPTMIELVSIVDYTSVGTTAFGPVFAGILASGCVWTSSTMTRPGEGPKPVTVGTREGNVSAFTLPSGTNCEVLCVLSPNATTTWPSGHQRFRTQPGDGTVVRDTATHLDWNRTMAKTSVPVPVDPDCAANGAGWRSPTVKELATLVDETVWPPIDVSFASLATSQNLAVASTSAAKPHDNEGDVWAMDLSIAQLYPVGRNFGAMSRPCVKDAP